MENEKSTTSPSGILVNHRHKSLNILSLDTLLQHEPNTKVVKKKLTKVSVKFAASAGKLKTLEGWVSYEQGAAILTGESGDTWPVEIHQFELTYEPIGNTKQGENGSYCKKPLLVYALELSEKTSVEVGYANDPITGNIGDWLVQYGPKNFGIVAKIIFEKTYDILS